MRMERNAENKKNNFKLIIGYDGTRYHGWEHKQGRDTVQGRLLQVLSRLSQEPVHVIGGGRTDAGVHARGMVANVFLVTGLTAEEVKDYVNQYLPDDIVVYHAEMVPERFHARYNATGKTYRYTLYDGHEKPVFDRKYVWALESRVDTDRMRTAADLLMGTHDYAGFCKNPQKKKSTVRTVDHITIERQGDYVMLTFHGDGFLHHMVRIMTGTLVEVGLSKRDPGQVLEALSQKDRLLAGVTAPAQGLCLMQMDYPAR